MEKVIAAMCRRKILIPAIYAVAVILSIMLVPFVNINYDLAEYLPDASNTKKAITAMEAEFGYPGTVQVMLNDVGIAEAMDMKRKISGIEGVKSVLWLDDVVDIAQPVQSMPDSALDSFYKDGSALFQVEFADNDYSQAATNAIEDIRALVGDEAAISGPAENSRHMKEVLANEITKILLIVVPICLVILFLASSTWIEPLLYIGIIGISILINMGTNIVFRHVSFITYSMSAVLQLAMAMDYSLFLMHRYLEERDKGSDAQTSVIHAVHGSISSIAASALTTIAGFLALILMKYGLGTDIGLVLAKGILISFITVITLMPVVILLLHKTIDKTRHKVFTPSFKAYAKIGYRLRYLILALALIVAVPAFLAQQNNEFLFGDTSASSSEGKIAEDSKMIADKFGINNTVLLLVPSGQTAQEAELARELDSLECIGNVQSLATLADPSIPREFLPESVRKNFVSDNYSRFIINLNTEGETDASFAAVDQLKETADKFYPGQWMTAGTMTSIADIKSTVNIDIYTVNLYSIIAVALIILLTFRSLSLPVILVAVIELSTWINMSIPYFTDQKLAFIGYLVVGSLQLGATIDYAILLSNRYMDFRKTMAPKDAASAAIQASGNSIIISALILSTAGFSFGLMSQIDAISGTGTLIGRGAALSGFMVLTLLPVLLILLDKLIMKTTKV